ncbi:MAG TPA: hypothetical protein VEX68_24970 [Bryobacteraceae bacterium]|nr:hypothetical protein [Bryobacteraceae bacterium]
MKGLFQQRLSATMAMVVLTVFSAPEAFADNHIVPAEIQGKISQAANERTKNIEDIQRVLSYPAAAEALKKYNVNSDQMKTAVATLSDAELSRLSDVRERCGGRTDRRHPSPHRFDSSDNHRRRHRC